jgi:hypothetical protein
MLLVLVLAASRLAVGRGPWAGGPWWVLVLVPLPLLAAGAEVLLVAGGWWWCHAGAGAGAGSWQWWWAAGCRLPAAGCRSARVWA